MKFLLHQQLQTEFVGRQQSVQLEITFPKKPLKRQIKNAVLSLNVRTINIKLLHQLQALIECASS